MGVSGGLHSQQAPQPQLQMGGVLQKKFIVGGGVGQNAVAGSTKMGISVQQQMLNSQNNSNNDHHGQNY